MGERDRADHGQADVAARPLEQVLDQLEEKVFGHTIDPVRDAGGAESEPEDDQDLDQRDLNRGVEHGAGSEPS